MTVSSLSWRVFVCSLSDTTSTTSPKDSDTLSNISPEDVGMFVGLAATVSFGTSAMDARRKLGATEGTLLVDLK
jgi:hypothetical protein